MPIGSNPGQGSVTYGTAMTSVNDECRAGTSAHNPCALSVGSGWTVGVGLSGYDHATAVTTFKLTFRHSKAIPVGSVISITLPTSAYTSGLDTSTVITNADTKVAAVAITDWTAVSHQTLPYQEVPDLELPFSEVEVSAVACLRFWVLGRV